MKKSKLIFFALCTAFIVSCNNKPKVITAQTEPDNNEKVSGIFSDENADNQPANSQLGTSFTEDLHKVVVQEILPATKYVYLKVTEVVEKNTG